MRLRFGKTNRKHGEIKITRPGQMTEIIPAPKIKDRYTVYCVVNPRICDRYLFNDRFKAIDFAKRKAKKNRVFITDSVLCATVWKGGPNETQS